MQTYDIGDLIICNDVLGTIVDITNNHCIILTDDGSRIKIRKSANINLIANAYSIATLVYNKVLHRCKG